MTRGQKANVGDTSINANGYHNTRVEEGWRLTHHIIMEETLGRKLRPNERVVFKDGKRDNLDPSNIVVSTSARGSLRRKKAQLEERIRELQAQLDDVIDELAKV